MPKLEMLKLKIIDEDNKVLFPDLRIAGAPSPPQAGVG